jgi:hypothetical protein
VRYAYLCGARRLAVKTGGEVWVYDTLDHSICGFSQQQGSGSDIVFGSQYGTANLASLPLVSRNGQPYSPPAALQGMQSPQQAPQTSQQASQVRGASSEDVLAAIEKLGDLKAKGFISEDEFASKKSELLSRL